MTLNIIQNYDEYSQQCQLIKYIEYMEMNIYDIYIEIDGDIINEMTNRKQQILQLQAVSKCKKQKSNSFRKIENKKNTQNIQFIVNLDQQYPQPEIQHHMKLQLQKQTSFPYESRDFEDSNLTKHIAQQLLIIKIMMMIMTILSILLARIGQDAAIIFNGMIGQNVVLIAHTVITVTITTMAIMKHIKTRQLTIKQLIKFSPYQLNILGINRIFILELLFLLMHPNVFSKNQFINIRQPIHEQFTKLSVNHLLQIFMLCRIYLVYSAIVSSTIYLSTRGSRICRIYGTNCNLYFGAKCLFNTRPLYFLVIIFVTMLFVFGEMVRLSEENVPHSQLGNFGNSLWCVMITMGTVGYGDYSPKTYLGRALLFLASITGIIVASLLILTLSTYLSMELSENKAHITMQRLVLRDKLESLAKGVMHQAAVVSKLSGIQGEKPIKFLKKKTDDVKYTLRKIKNLIDTDNINEEMDRLFESLEDNMKDAYINQTRYAQALHLMHQTEIDKISQMKFSFTEEIEKIIKDK